MLTKRIELARVTVLSLVLACGLLIGLASEPAHAAVIGSPIQVKDVGCWWPEVCYNAYSDQYLVFWGDYNVAPQVRARRVDSDTGVLLGSELVVSNWSDSYRTYMGDAVYNSINHEWFVVYTWCLPDQPEDIYGQRIDSSGNQVGSYIALCTDGSYQSQAAVTFDSYNNRYLATWTDWTDVRKIRGRLFDQYGSPVGSQMQISDSSIYKKSDSSCIYNPISNEFLVVWSDDRNWTGEGNNNNWGDIYAQRINASTGALIGGNYMVCGPEGTPYVPDGMDLAKVVCNTQNGRYFLAVTRLLPVGGWVTIGRILNPDGSAYTGLFDVSYPDNGSGVGAVYNPVENSFVMSYLDGDLDVSAQRFSSNGTPLGSPYKVFSSNYECNYGGLTVRPSDGQMMQVTIWFQDKYTAIRYNILEAQRFDVSGIPPAPVTNFVAYSANQQNNITWTNPADPIFTGTMIRYRTDTYPTSPTDGTLVVNKSGTPGANDSYLHTGLTNGVTYYYTAFTHDAVPLYSVPRHSGATPTAPTCFQDSFSYANGALNGNGGWSGSAGSSQIAIDTQTVKVLAGAGSYDAVHTTLCGDPGQGYIWVDIKIKAGSGSTTMWSLYIDDLADNNLARWYGSGTTARGRIGGTASVTATETLTGGWDDLAVKIDPYNNTSEFFFNGSSIGTLDHGQTGAGDLIGRIRFDRMESSSYPSDYLYFDSILIGQSGGDIIPPGPVTNFAATAGDGQDSLSWTNPTDGDFAGTKIMFKTTGYPTGPTDGTQCYNGTGTSYVHTGLTNGTTYYYSAYSYDAVPNYASAANASATPTAAEVSCYQDSFSYSDGALNGNGGWSGSAGSSAIGVVSQTVKINGGATAYDAIHTTNCGDPGPGYMWVNVKCKSGVGTSNIWNLWIDDLSGLNLARWYGSGTTARGRIGATSTVTASQTLTGGWDDLSVKINPTANTSEFFFNGTSIGVLDHGQTGAGDVIGRLRFERMDTGSNPSDYAYFDSLLIGDSDSTPPGPVTSFTATSGDTQNSLSWTNPGDADFAGVKIMFKTNGYPTGPDDGAQCYNSTGTSTVHTGLTNGVAYYYSAFAYDAVPNYSTAANASAVPADVTAPANVTSFTATSGDTQNSLSWTEPGDADLAGVKIMFKTTGYPSGPADGTQCYSGMGTSYAHTGLTNGTTYYYKAFSYDEVPNYASGAQTSGVPADVTPPANVTGFTAKACDGKNTLSWTNPGDADFAGTKVLFKTTGYPSSATDGTVVYDGTGTSCAHTGLTNGVTYYYTAFSYDEVPNFASGAQASAVPSVPTVNVKLAGAIAIDGATGDWNLGDFTTTIRGGESGSGDIALVGYDGGSLYYAGYWTGGVLPTSDADHTAKVYSRHDSKYQYFLVRCDDSDILYPYAVDANWANDCVEFYLDPGHDHGSSPLSDSTSDIQLVIDANNQKNVYCCTSGYATQVLNGVASAVVRDGSGWWCEARILKTTIDPDLPSTGTIGVEFNFRDNDNNNDPAQTTVYSWSDTEQSGGFPSKIPDRWGNASIATDNVAPANVTDFAATPADSQISLSWTNPTDTDYVGTKVLFKTTGYPSGPTDGTVIYDGTGTSYIHTGLTNGTTYYYKAFTYDGIPNYSSGAQASAVPADVTPPGNVTSFTATAGDTQNSLSWTNPGDSDLAGVKIMFKTTGYPSGPADGTQCYNGLGTSYVHTGLTNGTTYYYKAFSYDEVPNYASGSQASATPTTAYCFRDQFSYADGALNGNGGWSGSATSAQIAIVSQTVKIIGGATSYDASKTVSCGDGGLGYIWVRCKIQKGSGSKTNWNLWINDSSGKNFARWYGTGTTARGRIGGTNDVTPSQTLTGGWDNIDVKIVPSAQTAQFFFNGTSIGTLSYSSQGTGNTIAQLRFERGNNNAAAGEYTFFDDLRVGGN